MPRIDFACRRVQGGGRGSRRNGILWCRRLGICRLLIQTVNVQGGECLAPRSLKARVWPCGQLSLVGEKTAHVRVRRKGKWPSRAYSTSRKGGGTCFRKRTRQSRALVVPTLEHVGPKAVVPRHAFPQVVVTSCSRERGRLDRRRRGRYLL